MQSDISRYTPLKTVVSYFLDESNSSVGDFDRCWILGLRGLTNMNYSVAAQTKTVRLPVSANKTVPIPSDYLSWSKIGNLNESGEVVTLKVNNSLTTFRDNNPNRIGDLSADINNGIGSLALVPYYANFYYGGGCYQLFGYGNGVVTYGECKVDEKNMVIILPPDFRYDSIILEYMSSPEKDEDYQVPTCLQEAVISFIKWKLKLGTREEYYAAVTEGRRSLPKKRVELQTINQIVRESNGMKLRS